LKKIRRQPRPDRRARPAITKLRLADAGPFDWRADAPREPTTCYNRFVRWRKAGVWDRIMAAVSQAYDGNVQMIDSTSVRVHQHAANSKKATRIAVWAARAAG
jgi:transposase